MAMPDMPAHPGDGDKTRRRLPSFRLLVAAWLALVVATIALLWLVSDEDGSSPPASDIAVAAVESDSGTGPVAVSAGGLRTLASAFEQPVYWAGPRAGYKYALRQAPDGDFYVRYLPPGVSADEGSRHLLVIGTYPLRNAVVATERAARREGGVLIRIASGGIAYYREHAPTNVFVAYPGSDYQAEVFDPSAERVHRLVVSGRIVPVG
jgi:hypothetical protein